MKKIHLRYASGRHAKRGVEESHRKFVESDNNACLTCARVCGCEDCRELRYAFGKSSTR
jgi:hypothetical protein